MKLAGRIVLVLLTGAASITAQVQSPVEQVRPPVEIVKHKIGIDYYPMLDRPSSTTPSMSAENGDMPMSDAERLARQRGRNSSNRGGSATVASGDTRSRGRLRSYTRVIDAAEYVLIELKNSNSKAIKSVEWDFAFPRYENGQLMLRFDVKSTVEIKPGGKKTLKHKLPPNAKKCEVVKVISDEEQPDKVSTFEAVCGLGFHDPSLLNQKQETITIQRIEFMDGTVWSRH